MKTSLFFSVSSLLQKMAGTGLMILICILGTVSGTDEGHPAYDWPATLSEWELFDKDYSNLNPSSGVFQYEVNSPLFSDYAHKSRHIYIPEGTVMTASAAGPFDMPDGTVLIKSFYYPEDFRNPSENQLFIETRLMVYNKGEWHGAAYVWNEERTEAYLSIAGESREVSWRDDKGKSQKLNYLVPNINQCKNCHTRSGSMQPIGISANQLDHNNQLTLWQDMGILEDNDALNHLTALPDYSDSSLPVDVRARSYLHANCSHCHSPYGPANSSGLYLNYDEQDLHKIGVNKSPIAAGRGSGGKLYNIVPGKPGSSILLHRMQSDDPGVRMPEINRQLEHKEGVAIIKRWIKEMSL